MELIEGRALLIRVLITRAHVRAGEKFFEIRRIEQLKPEHRIAAQNNACPAMHTPSSMYVLCCIRLWRSGWCIEKENANAFNWQKCQIIFSMHPPSCIQLNSDEGNNRHNAELQGWIKNRGNAHDCDRLFSIHYENLKLS